MNRLGNPPSVTSCRRLSPTGAVWRINSTLVAVVLVAFAGCGNKDPFSYAKVSGKVVYEDGSLIPVDSIMLTFYPQGGELDAKTRPRPGKATVDVNTGEFHNITSNRLNDGLVRGKHKVTLRAGDGQSLPAELVPPEYRHPFETPLLVDTAESPFELRVKKP